jgi:glycosyltransferase involved in cell wall biosynthesis
MIVALDAAPLELSSGGLRRYTEEISRALLTGFPDDVLYLVPPRPGRWWLWGLPREMARLGAEVFHGTNFEVPVVPARPSVLTLHDLSPWHGTGPGRVRRRTPALIRLGIATTIITPTEAVKREAVSFFGVHPARVFAIPEAAAPHLRRVSVVAGPPYFLYVGALEERKNIGMLVDAWRAIRTGTGVDLVLVGKPRPEFPIPSTEPGLRVLGEAPEEELAALYSGALALVYPSLYEGFGLPVIEAMQCGTAVIASRIPAIAEVAGDAALLLDPQKPRAWVEALRAVATTPELLAGLRARGSERARQFSWSRTAELTRAVYIEARARFAA